MLPHTGGWSQWRDSGVVAVSLSAGRSYTVHVADGWNMSFLEHYRNYSGPGGGAGSSNFVNIEEMKVLYRPELDR